MRTWFICKVKYTKEVEGKLKKVSEPYLVDALSFTEAEARIHQELEQMVRGEFSVENISKGNFADIFHYEDVDTWYKCKVTYITYSEESGKEKKTHHNMLVTAENVGDAYKRLKESLKDLMVDYEVAAIVSSPIVDIFPYDAERAGKIEVRDEVVEAVKNYVDNYSIPDIAENVPYEVAEVARAVSVVFHKRRQEVAVMDG